MKPIVLKCLHNKIALVPSKLTFKLKTCLTENVFHELDGGSFEINKRDVVD